VNTSFRITLYFKDPAVSYEMCKKNHILAVLLVAVFRFYFVSLHVMRKQAVCGWELIYRGKI
jgi:hypothetical protein